MDFTPLSNALAAQSASSAALGAIVSPPPPPASIGYKSLQKITVKIAAGTQQAVQASGNFVYLISNSNGIANNANDPITIQPVGNAILPLTNATLELRWDSDFTQLLITAPASSSATSTIVFIVGYGDYKDYAAVTNVTNPTFTAEDSFLRPNNAIAYAANQSMTGTGGATDILNFASIGRSNANGISIRRAYMQLASTVTANASFRLFLYDTQPTVIADQAAYPIINGVAPVGMIDFPAFFTGGAGSTHAICEVNDLDIFVPTSGVTQLYGQLMTLAAYTPTALEVVFVRLSGTQF